MTKTPTMQIASFAAVLLLAAALTTSAQQTSADDNPQNAEITKTAEAFVAAFQKGDAKALADFWTPDGDYVDENGRVLKGREVIEKSFAELFAEHKGLKLRIDVAARKFPTPDMAIEDGTSAVLSSDGMAPSQARYTNVLVKQDGKWMLSSVREAAYPEPSNFEYLRGLDWMVGDWVEDSTVAPVAHVSFEWAPGQNFLISTRTVEYKDATMQNGTQRIGWDPVAKQIRSWIFEGDGGFGEGVWTNDGAKWTIKMQSTVVDGSKAAATAVLTRVDANTVTFQLKDQTLNDKSLPDGKVIKMKRTD